jgi:hypothetical protein
MRAGLDFSGLVRSVIIVGGLARGFVNGLRMKVSFATMNPVVRCFVCRSFEFEKPQAIEQGAVIIDDLKSGEGLKSRLNSRWLERLQKKHLQMAVPLSSNVSTSSGTSALWLEVETTVPDSQHRGGTYDTCPVLQSRQAALQQTFRACLEHAPP